MRTAAGQLATARGVDELCTLSTVIHRNSQKEKEAKRKRTADDGLLCVSTTTTATTRKTDQETDNNEQQKHDISTCANYLTFLNALDNQPPNGVARDLICPV